MFEQQKEEDKKELVEKPSFRFVNANKGNMKEVTFRELFPEAGKEDRHAMARINNWMRFYSLMEKEALCEIALEYKNYFSYKWNYIDYFRAIKFLINIQSGMSRFDSYLDVFHDYEEVDKFKENKDKEIRRKLMVAVASYSNNRLVITLAQALDAPIQISYQGYKHQMIEVLRDIAVNGTSQREKVNAANSLLQHLNPNEMSSLQINIGVQKKEKSFIEQAQEALKLIAGKKLEDIKAGTKAEDVINVDVIETVKMNNTERKEDE